MQDPATGSCIACHIDELVALSGYAEMAQPSCRLILRRTRACCVFRFFDLLDTGMEIAGGIPKTHALDLGGSVLDVQPIPEACGFAEFPPGGAARKTETRTRPPPHHIHHPIQFPRFDVCQGIAVSYLYCQFAFGGQCVPPSAPEGDQLFPSQLRYAGQSPGHLVIALYHARLAFGRSVKGARLPVRMYASLPLGPMSHCQVGPGQFYSRASRTIVSRLFRIG